MPQGRAVLPFFLDFRRALENPSVGKLQALIHHVHEVAAVVVMPGLDLIAAWAAGGMKLRRLI